MKAQAIKTYEIIEAGYHIGTLELTPDQVRKLTAQAIYIIKEVR